MALQMYGRDWNKENKSGWNLCGGREKVLESFQKMAVCSHACKENKKQWQTLGKKTKVGV
jgi:hypothetical protein